VAYQRVTLSQLKDRLAERLGGQGRFWSEAEQELALNEALAVWQLMTGDFVKSKLTSYGTPVNPLDQTTMDTPFAGTLRVQCLPCYVQSVSISSIPLTAIIGEPVTFIATPVPLTGTYTYLWDFGDALPRIPRSGLVAHWTMDEPAGSTRVNTLGSGGTNCDLLEVSGTVTDSAGQFNNCAEFNPIGVGSPYLETVDVPPFGRGVGTDGYTIAGWVWRNNDVDNKTIIAKDGNLQSDFLLFEKTFYVDDDDNNGTFLALWDYNDPLASGGPAIFRDNQWDFFVGWVDFVSGTIGAQINGGNPKTKPISGTFVSATTSKVRFGVRVYNLTEYFDGKVDSWVAYDRVLTADERLILYDGMSRLASPIYTYQSVEALTASLTITDVNGCTATDAVNIEVVPVPPVYDVNGDVRYWDGDEWRLWSGAEVVLTADAVEHPDSPVLTDENGHYVYTGVADSAAVIVTVNDVIVLPYYGTNTGTVTGGNLTLDIYADPV
jgi:hypothetical protein